MLFDGCGRAIKVARLGVFGEINMLLANVAFPRRQAQSDRPISIALGALEQVFPQVEEDAVGTSGDERPMEGDMRVLPYWGKRKHRAVLAEIMKTGETVQCSNDPAFPLEIAESHRLAQARDLDLSAQFIELLEIFP